MADGVFDDDEFIGRPPAPADRPWRHPSEMAVEARTAQRRTKRRFWGVGLGSAIGGASVVAALWYLSTPGTDIEVVTQQIAVAPIESIAPRLTPAEAWADEVTGNVQRATALIGSDDGTHAIAGAVAVHGGGYLLTSGRAVDGQPDLTLHTHDGTMIEATVLGYDDETDLTVLKTTTPIDTAGVAATPAANGDVVAMVGPTGDARTGTVTDLAASATTIDGDVLVGFTSLDTQRNDILPGSPVVDATGAVTGITTAAKPGAPMTIVPIDVANSVAESIITDGRVWHAWLGVTVSATDGAGVIVNKVEADGPAERAGVREGDVVLAVDGFEIDSAAGLVSRLRRYQPNTVVELLVEGPERRVVLDASLDIDPEDLSDSNDG